MNHDAICRNCGDRFGNHFWPGKGGRCTMNESGPAFVEAVLVYRRDSNHWAVKCLNCGHRKGCHQIAKVGFQLKELGHCCVRVYDSPRIRECKICECKGFSDGRHWKDGKRICSQ